jgi:hypothetical protein
MKKITAVVSILFGLYVMFSAVGVFVSSSNHMGSRIDIRAGLIDHRLSEMSNTDQLESDIGFIVSEGNLGFGLLGKALLTQFFSGICLVIVGSVFLPRRSKSSQT